MDNQAYLDQIATKPVKTPLISSSNLLSPKMVKLIVCAIIAIILLIVLGSLFGERGVRGRELAEQLSIRIDNISSSIRTYNTHIRSPELRSMAATLRDVLNNTSRDLSPLLTEDFKYDPRNPTQKIVDSEAEHHARFIGILDDARLNGILDQVYASTLTAEIAEIMYIQSELREITNSDPTKKLLDSSYNNLQNLHSKFFDFTNSVPN
jgi:hypothetical protein